MGQVSTMALATFGETSGQCKVDPLGASCGFKEGQAAANRRRLAGTFLHQLADDGREAFDNRCVTNKFQVFFILNLQTSNHSNSRGIWYVRM